MLSIINCFSDSVSKSGKLDGKSGESGESGNSGESGESGESGKSGESAKKSQSEIGKQKDSSGKQFSLKIKT